ncbi:MAG: hypothetical protein GX375_09835 [Clostridiales bacterium]|nr:hypothetical protein [Clostridiales bacterium]
MYSEIVGPTKDKGNSAIWTSFGLIVVLIAIVGLSNTVYKRYGINYSGYITVLLYTLIGVYVYKRKIMKYRYLLIKNELIFESLAGKRNREIIRVNLQSHLYFCPLDHEDKDKSAKYKSHYLNFDKKSSKAWVLAFKRGKKIHRIIFEPSGKLVELIKNS